MNRPILIYDSQLADLLLQQRHQTQADQFDEVWDGVYVMSPLANNEHQELSSELVAVLRTAIDWKGLGKTLGGANVSNLRENWQQNFRVPDVLVFGNDTSAIDENSHWFGGPELVIEIVSVGDRTYEKLEFFATVGTQELIVIDRHPWKLTLYRLNHQRRMEPAAISTVGEPNAIALQTFPLEFRLVAEPPSIAVSSNHQIVRNIAITLP